MARKSRKNVGLIGLGIIGSRVAATLRAAGFHVYVWNRSPRAEPNFLGGPMEIAEVCNVIQIFVSDAQALFETIDALATKLTPSHTILCNATVGPEATMEAGRLVQQCGAKFLDAPFTGSKGAAEKGELVYYIGGDDDVLRQVEPILQASSKAIVKIGKIGQAATVKIATNMLGAVTVQTLAEALALVKGAGMEANALANALEHHGVRSATLDMKLAAMTRKDFTPHFSMKHMFKDVQIGIHMANTMEMDLPATTATAGVMYGAISKGWGDLDFSALARFYEEEMPLELPDAEHSRQAQEVPVARILAPAPASEEESKDGQPEKTLTATVIESVVEPQKPEAIAEQTPETKEPEKDREIPPTKPKGFGWLFGKPKKL